MEFTGERVIPGSAESIPLFEEHLARYIFVEKFIRDQYVLDLGCGTGYGSYYLSQQKARFVLGTDLDGEAVEYADRHYQASNLAYIQHDALHLPFGPQVFDIVISFEVIEHLEPVTTYLSEIRRVLKDAGWFIGSTPNKILHSPDSDQPNNLFHYQEYDPTALELLLKEFFGTTFMLGQRPFQGFVIGTVPSDPNNDVPRVEFLPETVPMEFSIADSKDLIYLASNSHTQNDLIQKYSHSHYYLGQPISRYLMTAHNNALRMQQDYARIKNDYPKLEPLVKGYESGRFIRLMKRLYQWWSFLKSYNLF